jgi:hypothetical protein
MNRETAIKYAEHGLYVFSCKFGKTPAPGFKWKDWATNDPVEVAAIWSHYGDDCAPALHLGRCGLIVVDLDRKSGKDGVAAFDTLLDQHGGTFPQCPVTATPSGGYHLYFRQPADRTLGNRTGALPAGVDIRGEGGYVLAPDAILDDGTYYEGVVGWPDITSVMPVVTPWIVALIDGDPEPSRASLGGPGEQHREPVAPCPGAWNSRRATAYVGAAVDGWSAKLAGTPEGGRNNTLNDMVVTLAGYRSCPVLANSTVGQHDVWTAASWACRRNGYLPREVKAFEATFRSAWTAGLAKPCRGPAPDKVVTVEINL